MRIDIYDRKGNMMLTASADSSSRQSQEVGVENVVTVNFTTWEFVTFPAGAWIAVAGEKFKLRREYKPKQVNDRKYSYSMNFYGQEHDAQDLLFCRLNQGVNPKEDMESVFQYEGTPAELLEKVVENMNRNSEGVVWKAGEAVDAPRKSINFNGVFCWDALGMIAQTFETEWWRDGDYINLTKCERGEAVWLGYREGLRTGLQQGEAENAIGFYTRLIPVGSLQNINKEVYGHERLQLPDRAAYVDVAPELGLKEHREEAAFAEIYPHRVGTVSSVEMEEKKDDEHGDYTVYYFRDEDLPFNPNECLLPGKMINVRFTTGELANKDFEVIWNSNTQLFEIINVYPDETSQQPGGNLVPETGNEYVLWNIAMPLQYYSAAEEKFAAAVDDFIKNSKVDAATYSAQTDYIYLDEAGVDLSLGQRVTLLSDIYFDGGSRESRITKIVRSLERMNDATIECRNAVTQSWKSSVDSSLSSIHYSIAKELESVFLEVLQLGDKGVASDYNVFSALRSLNTFLRKDKEDATNFLTWFKAGLKAARLEVENNSLFGGDVSSSEFVSGMATGKGWAIQQKKRVNVAGEEELYTSAEVDELTVRKSLKIFEFVVSQLLGENDNRVFSGMMEVDHYDAQTGTIFLKTDSGKLYNAFRRGDVVRVQQFAGEDAIKSYELVVASAQVGNLSDGPERMDTITFNSFEGGDPAELIAEGDTLVRVDSVSDETRKGVVQVTSVGANAPYIDVVRGLKTNPDDALMARLGNLDGIYDAEMGTEQPSGSGLYAKNAYLRGKFVLSSGEDVKTELIAKDGLIKSAVQSLQNDGMSGKTVIYNASFTEGLKGWQTQNAGGFVLKNGVPVFHKGRALYSLGEIVAKDKYSGRQFYLSLHNSTVKQANIFFLKVEELDNERNVDVRFAMRYRTGTSAMLFVALENCDDLSANACRGKWTGASVAENGNIALATAWESTIEFSLIDCAVNTGDVLVVTKGYRLFNLSRGVEIKFMASSDPKVAEVRLSEKLNLLAAEVLPVSERFAEFNTLGRWNGSGNLEITYKADIDFYAVQLFSEPTEVRYATLLEQSDKLILMAAKNFNADGSVNAESEIVVKPEGVGLMTHDAAGNVATVGTYEDGVVKLTGEEVLLEGKVTANGNVEISKEGKLKAVDGEFSGKIDALSGTIGNFTIGEGLEYEDDTESDYKAVIDENGAEFSDTYKDNYTGEVTQRKSIKINGRYADKAEGARALQCYRREAADLVNNTFYETPALVELIDDSTLPTPVLKTKGGVIHEGAVLHNYAILTLESASSPNVLTINKGNKWFILNTSGGERAVFFPTLSDMLKMLCLSEADDKTFAVPLSVTVAGYSINNLGILLSFQSDEDKIIDFNGYSNSVEIASKATVNFLLVNDSEKGYNAIVINKYISE